MINVGIMGVGLYLPPNTISAKEISEKTGGVWSEQAIIEKLGIRQKLFANGEDGTQEMGAKAAIECVTNCKIDPKEIDVVLSVGEEWKEYPLTTTASYIQNRVGAVNAWAVDISNRCCSTVTAMKMAKDMLIADENINTVLIAGGYRNGDLIDFSDKNLSMLYDLSAGGGAMILKKNLGKNLLLGTGIFTDGELARTTRVELGGICNPFTLENVSRGVKTLSIADSDFLKAKLSAESRKNWFWCIDKALLNSGLSRGDIDYLDILHVKRSEHKAILNELGLDENQSTYLENFGHVGQVDQILSLSLGIKQGKISDGSVVCMLAAGSGGVWAANIVKWG